MLSSKEDPAVKKDAFQYGANDYLVKLPDKIELIARIRSHAKHYLLQLERNAAFFALREMQRQLQKTNAELERLSSLDGLTGIANRRAFDKTLEVGMGLAEALDGELCDDSRSVVTAQTVSHLKEEIEAYRFKVRMAGVKQRPL